MVLDQLVALAKKENINVYSIAEIHEGNLRIACVNPAHDCNDIYSVSKNFATTAVGILVDRGVISLQDTVYDFFHSAYPDVCGDAWKKVTVEHVITQTIGIDRGLLDIDNDDTYQYPTDDFLRIKLSAPLVYPAGTHFAYSDSNFYLAGRIVAQATGETLQSFLQHELFLPLGFQGHAWATCPHGHAIGGSGLYLSVRDMAHFGQLYLNRGVYNGKRILSEKWCDQATRNHVTVDAANKIYYGYSFWRHRDVSAYQGNGMHGQIIYVSPKRDLVVAWQCHDPEGASSRLSDLLLDQETE